MSGIWWRRQNKQNPNKKYICSGFVFSLFIFFGKTIASGDGTLKKWHLKHFVFLIYALLGQNQATLCAGGSWLQLKYFCGKPEHPDNKAGNDIPVLFKKFKFYPGKPQVAKPREKNNGAQRANSEWNVYQDNRHGAVFYSSKRQGKQGNARG